MKLGSEKIVSSTYFEIVVQPHVRVPYSFLRPMDFHLIWRDLKG